MELTCLNCTGTFEVDDADVDAAGGMLRCPLCGREQRFAARGARSIPDVEPVDSGARREPASDGFGSAFRKPMQAFGGRRTGRPTGGAAGAVPPPTPVRVDTDQMPAVDAVLPPPVFSAQPPKPVPVEPPPERLNIPKVTAEVDSASGLWIVKSPTGLILEFPSSILLVNWSAVVENPAPYQVSRGSDSWMSLEEFLRETKRGIRATQAFRRAPEGQGLVPVGGVSEGMPDGAPAPSSDAAAAVAAGDPNGSPRAPDAAASTGRNAVSTTAQFTFKIANSSKPGFPRWAIALIVGAVLALVGGGAASWFLFFRGHK
jgi:predicted Zn finger-like uncharacterized protein